MLALYLVGGLLALSRVLEGDSMLLHPVWGPLIGAQCLLSMVALWIGRREMQRQLSEADALHARVQAGQR